MIITATIYVKITATAYVKITATAYVRITATNYVKIIGTAYVKIKVTVIVKLKDDRLTINNFFRQKSWSLFESSSSHIQWPKDNRRTCRWRVL